MACGQRVDERLRAVDRFQPWNSIHISPASCPPITHKNLLFVPRGERGWRCCCRVSLAYRHHSSSRELHKRNYTDVDKSVDNCEMLVFMQFTGLNFSLACLWLSVPLDQWGTFL